MVVYKTTCLVNNKIYIGQDSNSTSVAKYNTYKKENEPYKIRIGFIFKFC